MINDQDKVDWLKKELEELQKFERFISFNWNKKVTDIKINYRSSKFHSTGFALMDFRGGKGLENIEKGINKLVLNEIKRVQQEIKEYEKGIVRTRINTMGRMDNPDGEKS